MSTVVLRPTEGRVSVFADGLCAEVRRRKAVAERVAAESVATQTLADERRGTILRLVQPALAGLMDGSVSTLAPLFATAVATGDDWKAFLVGMASSLGAGISMGFAEGLSDDGALSGRGSPRVRGLVCGLATAIGGIGHTLPFLLRDYRMAMATSLLVVFAELWAIAWIRHRFMDTPMVRAVVQIVLGGAIVLGVGMGLGAA